MTPQPMVAASGWRGDYRARQFRRWLQIRRDSIVGLERLLRYCARPLFAAEQLEIEAVGNSSPADIQRPPRVLASVSQPPYSEVPTHSLGMGSKWQFSGIEF